MTYEDDTRAWIADEIAHMCSRKLSDAPRELSRPAKEAILDHIANFFEILMSTPSTEHGGGVKVRVLREMGFEIDPSVDDEAMTRDIRVRDARVDGTRIVVTLEAVPFT